jgi:hypothetical protein
MTRAPETPIILWICAAVCAHFVFAEGGEKVAEKYEDSSYLLGMGARARGAAASKDQQIEVVTNEEGKPLDEEPPVPEEKKPKAKKEEKKPDEAKKPEPPKAPEQPKAPEVKIAVKEDDPLKKLDEVPLKQDNRIAVKQHAQKNQEDNPNAKFIADEANKVQEESVATQTAHDQDDPNPTPGANKTAGPQDKTGDSERTKIADSEEHKGEQNKAPGEKGTEFSVLPHDNIPLDKPQAQTKIAAQEQSKDIPRSGGDGRTPSQTQTNPNQPQLAPGAPPAPSPDVMAGANGTWIVNPMKPGLPSDPQQKGVPGTTNQKPPVAQSAPNTKWLGLGGNPGPGQLNLNLTQNGVVAAVGVDQLRKEREADGERRKSEHRGSWTASNFERWRNAIENYVSSVKPGNQTALNTAAVPFASYLNTIHNRIHPIFADNFLGSLDNLPKNHPMNDPKISTRLEIVVSPKEGRIVKMGVVKTSGITAFDIAALDSVNRAQPFGPAPNAIVSPDGNVYLHWEFHRDEVFACSTMHARPFMLNAPAKPQSPEPEPPGSPNAPTRERGVPANTTDTRSGSLDRHDLLPHS